MTKLKYLSLLVFILLTSCIRDNNLFENEIKQFSKPIKIEYFKHLEGQVLKFKENPEFSINKSQEIEEIIKEIKMANNPEPWEGIGWNKIIITYSDTILQINTNEKKIGLSASGMFYALENDNFITKRIKK